MRSRPTVAHACRRGPKGGVRPLAAFLLSAFLLATWGPNPSRAQEQRAQEQNAPHDTPASNDTGARSSAAATPKDAVSGADEAAGGPRASPTAKTPKAGATIDSTAGGVSARGHQYPGAAENAKAGLAAGAIDTTIPPGHRMLRAPGKNNLWNTLAKPRHATTSVREGRRQRPDHDPMGGVKRDAVGVPLANAATAKPSDAIRQFPGTAAAVGPPRTAAGTVTTITTGLPTSPIRQSAGPAAPASIPVARTGISGTGIVHTGSGPATLGGAAKNTTGINGSTFRPKH
jgi:hypothetical protein